MPTGPSASTCKDPAFSRPIPHSKEILPQHRPGDPQIRNKPFPTEHPPEPQNPRSGGCEGIWWDLCSVNRIWFVWKKNWLPDVDSNHEHTG